MQIPSGPLTCVSGDYLDVYVSRIYGKFNPAFISIMQNLEKVVISDTHIDPREFVDKIVDRIELQEIYLVNCTQFTEQQMIEMFSCLPNLRIIDATGNRGFQFVSAYTLCCNLRKLEQFKIEAKYPFYERYDWARLTGMFPNVNFGRKIKQIADCGKYK